MKRASLFTVLFGIATLAFAPGASAEEGGPGRLRADDDADLGKLVVSLTGEDAAARESAAKSIENLGPESLPAIAKELAKLRKAPAASPLETTELLKALAHIGTTPAVAEMIRVAGDHGGASKNEVSKQLKALGDKAIPALILSRKEPSGELRHWAAGQLEGMGKRVPGDAVQTKDNQVLAETLRAFATVHDMDALPVILSFVNSDRILVRGAAREAIGGFGQDAVWKLREAYANVVGKPAPETWTAAQTAKELFSAYDKLRLQEVYGLLDEGLAKDKAGDVDGAVAAFDKVLARQPMLDRRGEMVGAYVAYATKLEETDPPQALATYRKALRLKPDTARGPHIEAEIAYLEGKELQGRGVADPEPFKRALTLDPTHEKARAEHDRLDTDADERSFRPRSFAAAGAVVLVALTGILLFGGRRRPKRVHA